MKSGMVGYFPAELGIIGEYMPRIPQRWDGPNEWYFVSIATRDSEPVFSDNKAALPLKQAFREAHKYYPFRYGRTDEIGESFLKNFCRPDLMHSPVPCMLRDKSCFGPRV